MWTEEEARVVQVFLRDADWKQVPAQDVKHLGSAYAKLVHATSNGGTIRYASFEFPGPAVMLAASEATDILKHLQLWRDGEQLLSRSLAEQATAYCTALRILAQDAEQHYAKGIRWRRICL